MATQHSDKTMAGVANRQSRLIRRSPERRSRSRSRSPLPHTEKSRDRSRSRSRTELKKEADVTDPFYPFYPLYEMPWVFRWRLEYDADSYTGTKFNLVKVAKMGFELLCKFAKVELPPQKMQTSKGWGPSSGFDLVSTNCGMVLHVPEFAPEAAQKLAEFLQNTTTSALHEMLKKAQLKQSWWGSISQMTVCEKSGMISMWGSIFDDSKQ